MFALTHSIIRPRRNFSFVLAGFCCCTLNSPLMHSLLLLTACSPAIMRMLYLLILSVHFNGSRVASVLSACVAVSGHMAWRRDQAARGPFRGVVSGRPQFPAIPMRAQGGGGGSQGAIRLATGARPGAGLGHAARDTQRRPTRQRFDPHARAWKRRQSRKHSGRETDSSTSNGEKRREQRRGID